MAVAAKVERDHSLKEESQSRQEEGHADVKAGDLVCGGRVAGFAGVKVIQIKESDNEAGINDGKAGDPGQLLPGTARHNEVFPHDSADATKPVGKAVRAGLVRAAHSSLAALLNASSSFRVARGGVQRGFKNVGFLPQQRPTTAQGEGAK